MRLLWISFWGSWTKPLLEEIKKDSRIKLGLIVPIIGEQKGENHLDGVDTFSLELGKKELFQNMGIALFDKFNQIIKQFNPDVIHVHGTEKNLAQIQNFLVDIPIIISIQGIMTAYDRYDLNYLRNADFCKFNSLKNFLGRGGALQMGRIFKKSYQYEIDILRKGKYFFGRTDWDKARIIFNNPNAKYFQGEELLRKPFYDCAKTWNLGQCHRHSIFMPAGFNPIKGLHWAIEVVSLLKPFYPDVKLYVPGLSKSALNKRWISKKIIGENYIEFVKEKIAQLNMESHICFLERLTPEEMVFYMQKSHVFLSPSSVDNSPNAVGEATMIGTPVVITPVGGVPSFLKDGVNCLFAPAGDSYLMAYQVMRVFNDDDLASELSRNAYGLALSRHNRENVAEQYINTYYEVIRLHKAANI